MYVVCMQPLPTPTATAYSLLHSRQYDRRVGGSTGWHDDGLLNPTTSTRVQVNWQPCAKVTCSMTQEGVSYTMPRLLSTKHWPDAEDWYELAGTWYPGLARWLPEGD